MRLSAMQTSSEAGYQATIRTLLSDLAKARFAIVAWRLAAVLGWSLAFMVFALVLWHMT